MVDRLFDICMHPNDDAYYRIRLHPVVKVTR